MESYRTDLECLIMATSRMRDSVERWLIHESMSFEGVKSTENTFQVLVKHAGPYGIPIDIFEPKAQQGILVIGAKIPLKNNQIIRYRGFNEEEKAKLKEGETTTTTKNVSGSNNGFVARIANEAQITENVSFEIAYDFGMRKLNLESEKGGPTMTENKKDGSSKKVLFKDTRDNNTHTVSVSFNVNI